MPYSSTGSDSSIQRAGIILTLEQPLAAIFAVLILGEMLTGASYAGGAIIFIAMLVAEGGARLVSDNS